MRWGMRGGMRGGREGGWGGDEVMTRREMKGVGVEGGGGGLPLWAGNSQVQAAAASTAG